MKEKYLAEIAHFINEMNESQLKHFAEIAHFFGELNENQLLYILTFAKKMFGSH